ncbi:MAG TPA: heme o synthase [Verrucomicrobiales bacterium]|nr:heme o synthase [Verrucomicrobiales bacterium]
MKLRAMDGADSAGISRGDLVELTKARLSLLVVITALAGYLLAARQGGFDGWILLHMLLGTTLAAFASGVFNQILEADADALMRRTSNRPLPARRVNPTLAFAIGWFLAAIGLVHLLIKVNSAAALLTAATLAIYIFVYTPLKRVSSLNTLVGAAAGALPPLVGWTAGGGSLTGYEATFLFALLFLWQLPHFLAINWIYREEYERAGFVMWSNGDAAGTRTARLMVFFSLLLAGLMLVPAAQGFAAPWFAVAGLLLTGWLVFLALRFMRSRRKEDARAVFLYTLLLLPACLLILLAAWR